MNTAALPVPPLPRPGERWALFLDLDGTLAPLVDHPDSVRLEPGLLCLLDRLQARLDGALWILSGRPLRQLEALLADLPELGLVGSHGAEGWGSQATVPPPSLATMREAVAAGIDGLEGVWIETKPLGFTVHFRQRPEAADRIRALVARHLPGSPGLRAIEGACVAEVMAEGHNKGSALRRLSTSPQGVPRRPVVLGDDITDEDAFAAASSLRGFGVCVGPRRPTQANYGLPCVPLAHTWLWALADRLGPP